MLNAKTQGDKDAKKSRYTVLRTLYSPIYTIVQMYFGENRGADDLRSSRSGGIKISPAFKRDFS